jgi:multidrug efflux pump subunit AcrA (membrane-fusion protein)
MIFFSSCQQSEKKETPTYTVKLINYEDILEINGLVEPIQTTTIGCPREADGIITFNIEDGTYVNEGDTVCILEDSNLKKKYDDALINLETAKAELNKTKADLALKYALLEAQVKNNAAESDISNLDSLQLQYATPNQQTIKKLELSQVAIEKHKLEKKLKSLAIINQSELKKTEFQIQRLTTEIQSSKEQLDGLVIKSPKKGIVSKAMHYSGRKVQVGDNLWYGMAMVNIPDLVKMKVMITASEGDYKRISENDLVEYSFDAMPKNKAWGKILKKSPVGQPIKEDSKVKLFEIEATMDSASVIPGPGLSTNCKVILKLVKDTIVIPQIAIFEQDSMPVVFVKKGDKFEMRQVSVGISSPKSAIIVAGLKVGDKISFIKPGSSLIEKKTLLPRKIVKKIKKNRITSSPKKKL